MSKKFHAINRHTGERWRPERGYTSKDQFLVMYDSEALAVVTKGWDSSIETLDRSSWKAVIKESILRGHN